MTKTAKLGCIVIGSVIASVVSTLVFGTSLPEMLNRSYFTLGGAAMALWCFK